MRTCIELAETHSCNLFPKGLHKDEVVLFVKLMVVPSGKASIPANICWSWRRLQHVFSVTISRLPRRLEDVLQRHFADVLKTPWRRLRRRKIVTLKTSWRRLDDMSWRRLEDMPWRPLKDFMETNKILTRDTCILISG